QDAGEAVNIPTVADLRDREAMPERMGVDMGTNHARLLADSLDVAMDVACAQSAACPRAKHERRRGWGESGGLLHPHRQPSPAFRARWARYMLIPPGVMPRWRIATTHAARALFVSVDGSVARPWR